MVAFLRGEEKKGSACSLRAANWEPQALHLGAREGGVILRGSRVLKNNLCLHHFCHVCLMDIWH